MTREVDLQEVIDRVVKDLRIIEETHCTETVGAFFPLIRANEYRAAGSFDNLREWVSEVADELVTFDDDIEGWTTLVPDDWQGP